MTLTPEQLHILQHSLGCDKHGQTSYRGGNDRDSCWVYHRNRYASDPTADLTALVAAGLMKDYGKSCDELTGGMHFYQVTEAGVAAMKAASPLPAKLTAGQRRYREWRAADCGLTFMEWLNERAWRTKRARRFSGSRTAGARS